MRYFLSDTPVATSTHPILQSTSSQIKDFDSQKMLQDYHITVTNSGGYVKCKKLVARSLGKRGLQYHLSSSTKHDGGMLLYKW